MKKLLYILIIIAGIFSIKSVIVESATTLFPYQGGTGIGTATAGDVGDCLTVSDDAPFTYTLGPCGTGSGTADGQSNWLYNGSRLSPSTTVGIGVFASSTIGNGTGAGGLTVNGGATTTGNINVLSSAIGGDNNYDSTNRLRLTSYQKAQSPNHFGEAIRIDLASSSAKGMIAWRDAFSSSPKSVAWVGAHYLPNDVGDPIHEHLSFETKASSSDAIYTRLGIDYNKDIADIDFVDSDITIFNGSDDGKLFLQNDVFHHDNFQFFPYNDRADIATSARNRTYGLSIDLTGTSTGATSTILNALGGTKLFFNDDLINLSNKIGIGTSSPNVPLEVWKSDANTTITTGNNAAIRITNPNTTDNNMGELSFTTVDAGGTNLRTSAIIGINKAHNAGAMSGELAFITRNAGTYAERMRISSNGNVGIGTTTPSRLLTVQGNGYFLNNVTAASSTITGTTTTGMLALTALPTNTAGNALCIVGTAVVTAGGTTCVTSSGRFKQDVEPLSDWKDILDIDVVSFNYKPQYADDVRDAGGKRLGFIAEQVEEVDPRLVQYDAEGNPLSVHFDGITAKTVLAIQEMQKEIDGITGKAQKSAQDNWQWVALFALFGMVIRQQRQINKLK